MDSKSQQRRKIEYDEEVDILTLRLRGGGKYSHAEEKGEDGQVVVHVGSNGEVLRLEVLDAPRIVSKSLIKDLLERGHLSKAHAEDALKQLDAPMKRRREEATERLQVPG